MSENLKACCRTCHDSVSYRCAEQSVFAKTGLAKNIQDAITNTVAHLLDEGNKATTVPTAGGEFIL